MSKTFRSFTVLACALALAGVPGAFAANKDLIALQAQVQQMQEMMMSMQQSNDERYATMHNLLQQTADSVSKMSGEIDTVQKAVQAAQGTQGSSVQQLSGQMQSMNDSLDELRARLDKLDKTLDNIQSQQQSLAAGQALQPGQTPQGGAQPSSGASEAPQNGQPAAQPAAPQAPPVDQLYQSAASDYNSAKYNLASQEFGDVIKFYPQSTQAGNSQFYLGEVDYRSGNYKGAIDNYAQVISQYPGSPKAPTAMLRKGQSELTLGQREAGIRDMRALIQRYPQTPEAMQARSKLNGMGVRIFEKPSAAHRDKSSAAHP